MVKTNFPDGIDEGSMNARNPRRVIFIRFLIFGSILALALLGLFGGHGADVESAESTAARFTVESPGRLRNGNLFEARFIVAAKAPIDDAVIAVPSKLWHEATINSLVPAPAEEEWVDGEFRFHMGPIEAGKSMLLKVDGQLNPAQFGAIRGDYRLLDGTREIARIPVRLEVIP